jgi:hypothetical protein
MSKSKWIDGVLFWTLFLVSLALMHDTGGST